MTKTIATVFALATVLSATACNTVNGAGKDLKSAGEAVSGASGEPKK